MVDVVVVVDVEVVEVVVDDVRAGVCDRLCDSRDV